MRHAFVTGASGFVGINLVRALCARNWKVTILARQNSSLADLEQLPLQVVYGDITDSECLNSAISHELDAVFHVAASTSVWRKNNDDQRLTNVTGTKNVVRACLHADRPRLIYFSSFAVYGFHHGVITESTQRRDNADWINYVATKYQAEQSVRNAVRDHNLDAIILNPGHILGPYDRHNWARMFLLVYQKRLPGVPPGSGSFADVREIAKAAITAYEYGKQGDNYLLGGSKAQFIELVHLAGKMLDRKVPSRALPAFVLRLVGRISDVTASITGREPDITPESAAMITQHILCDSSKAERELDYQTTELGQLVQDTIDWMRGAGLFEDKKS